MRPMALSCSFFMVLALGAVTVSTVRADDNHTMPSLTSTIEGFKRKLGMNVDPSEFLHHLQGGLNTMSENYLVVPFWDLHITTKDGITLIASAFVPIRWTFEPLPVVIFPNSWSLPYLEYTSRPLSIASRGYIVVQYQTRGFWFSGGIVDTAGPLDLSDGSDVIDYVLSQWTWRPLKDKIAFCGISYGAGISFLMGGYDARVTTVIPMSGWANLTEMAYARQTPSTMVNALISMGGWTGRLPPALPQMLKDLISHTNMADAVAYSNPRSPQKFLDAMNARKLPVLIFNNYWDELFRPQTMLTLFRKLQGPKKLVLNEGSHAIPEAKGLFAASYVWDRTQDWLDLWLKGVKTNNVMALPEVQTELGPSVGVASPNYLPFSNWRHSTKKLFLTPRGSSGLGSLAPAAPTSSTEKSIQFTPTPPFNAGFNNESGMDAGKPYMVQLTGQDQATSVVWQSAPFTAPFNLCGTPTFDLTFRSTHDTWQVFTTLYDVAPGASQGSLLSHGFYSWYPDGPLAAGTPAVKAEGGTWKITGVEFHTMCRTVAAGHSLAVALVLLHSDLFYPANNASDFAVTVAYGAGSFISLPVLAQP